MRNLIILLFVAIAARTTFAEPLLDDLFGNLGAAALGGGDPAGAFINKANGKNAPLLADPIIDLGKTLGTKNTACLKLCPVTIADPALKCVKPTTFREYPRCYQINSKNKYVWPCPEKITKNKPKQEEDEDEE